MSHFEVVVVEVVLFGSVALRNEESLFCIITFFSFQIIKRNIASGS
jgi:hypothetical protein